MKTFNLDDLKETLYYKRLKNGLCIYIIPNNKVNDIYATFTTNYGGTDIEFVPIGKEKLVKMPTGIAHFLEHKLFEQENGDDPFTYFSNSGTSANAYTSHFNTLYMFKGPNNFEGNLNYLLDFVQSPYFTAENVKKEKGIILEEEKMVQDRPDSIIFTKLLANIFHEYGIKYPIIGTTEDIKRITKKDIYTCYNTFYHPSNMALIITGNVDPEEAIEIATKNQSEKDYTDTQKILRKRYIEPVEVVKEYEEKEMSVTRNKILFGFKIKLDTIEADNIYLKMKYLNIIFDNNFGALSDFSQEMKEKGIISNDLGIGSHIEKDYALIFIKFEANDAQKAIKAVKTKLKNLLVSRSESLRIKKIMKSEIVRAFNKITEINDLIVEDLFFHHEIIPNKLEQLETITFNKVNNVLDNLDISNYSIYVIKPNEK